MYAHMLVTFWRVYGCVDMAASLLYVWYVFWGL